jgi:hypothetical protein
VALMAQSEHERTVRMLGAAEKHGYAAGVADVFAELRTAGLRFHGLVSKGQIDEIESKFESKLKFKMKGETDARTTAPALG